MILESYISESVEMYLIRLSTMGAVTQDSPLSISGLAEQMGVQPVSANQMVKKLEEEGWVKYLPYKGVYLTKAGQDQALRVLRHRRLWEVFLVRELEMSVEDADELACSLEHLSSEDVTNRLDAFLGHPTISYTGFPIPQGEDEAHLFTGMPISNLKIDDSAQVMRVNGDDVTAKFLSDEGIKPGVMVRIVAIGSNGDLLVENKAKRIRIAADLCANILVGEVIQSVA
jgi:DtxR family Mn-dependent transcriptional regulator